MEMLEFQAPGCQKWLLYFFIQVLPLLCDCYTCCVPGTVVHASVSHHQGVQLQEELVLGGIHLVGDHSSGKMGSSLCGIQTTFKVTSPCLLQAILGMLLESVIPALVQESVIPALVQVHVRV